MVLQPTTRATMAAASQRLGYLNCRIRHQLTQGIDDKMSSRSAKDSAIPPRHRLKLHESAPASQESPRKLSAKERLVCNNAGRYRVVVSTRLNPPPLEAHPGPVAASLKGTRGLKLSMFCLPSLSEQKPKQLPAPSSCSRATPHSASWTKTPVCHRIRRTTLYGQCSSPDSFPQTLG
jgi:hypothetical protein